MQADIPRRFDERQLIGKCENIGWDGSKLLLCCGDSVDCQV